MKYSILTLLAATAYVSMFFAAFLYPLTIWLICSLVAALCMFAYFVALAFEYHDLGKAVFGRVAAILTVAYMLVSIDVPYSELDHEWDLFPHQRLTIVWFENQPKGDNNIEVRSEIASTKVMNPLFRIQCALMLGFVGGSIALWRYRRNEKAHTESGGS